MSNTETQTLRLPYSGDVVAGQRPTGSTPADGSHIWATYHRSDNLHVFTTYNGWLIDTETKTTSSDIAAAIEQHIQQSIPNAIDRAATANDPR